MGIFHRHYWKEVSRAFHPGREGKIKLESVRDDLWLQMVYGITAVEYKCEKCGITVEKILTGDHLKRS